MLIYLLDKKTCVKVTLRAWNDDTIRYEPDIFADLNDNLPRDFPPGDTDCQAAMTLREYDALVTLWEDEVDEFNAGMTGTLFDGDPTDYYDFDYDWDNRWEKELMRGNAE